MQKKWFIILFRWLKSGFISFHIYTVLRSWGFFTRHCVALRLWAVAHPCEQDQSAIWTHWPPQGGISPRSSSRTHWCWESATFIPGMGISQLPAQEQPRVSLIVVIFWSLTTNRWKKCISLIPKPMPLLLFRERIFSWWYCRALYEFSAWKRSNPSFFLCLLMGTPTWFK